MKPWLSDRQIASRESSHQTLSKTAIFIVWSDYADFFSLRKSMTRHRFSSVGLLSSLHIS